MAEAAGGNHLEIVKQCRKWILATGSTPNYTLVIMGAQKHTLLKKWQQRQSQR